MRLTEALAQQDHTTTPVSSRCKLGVSEQIAHHEAKEGENVQKAHGAVLPVIRISATLPSAGYVRLSRL
jgi:hypothetical protein